MNFIVEDEAHRLLVMTLLGVSRKSIDLGGSRGDTCRIIARQNSVVGMIDEDPNAKGVPNYLRNLPENRLLHDIKHFQDPQGNNRIIMLCPSVEVWVFDKARRKKLDLQMLVGTTLPSEFHSGFRKHSDKWIRLIRHLHDHPSEALLYLKSLLLGEFTG